MILHYQKSFSKYLPSQNPVFHIIAKSLRNKKGDLVMNLRACEIFLENSSQKLFKLTLPAKIFAEVTQSE